MERLAGKVTKVSELKEKYKYYFSTTDENEYNLHLAAVKGTIDFYEARGYDYQFDNGIVPDSDPVRYYVSVEVYDFD